MSPQSSALPPRPSRNLLSKLANGLRKAHRAREPEAIRRFLTHHPKFASYDESVMADTEVSLRDAQLVIAREHGFENWTLLKRHVVSSQDRDNDDDLSDAVIRETVPFFAVSDMQASLEHYVHRLGFSLKNKWIDDGKLRWCWLVHGQAALMLQEFHTEGKNARVFEGRRGGGTRFVYTTEEEVIAPAPAQDGAVWPFGEYSTAIDDDGYSLLARPGKLTPESTGADPLTRAVPVLSVSNFQQSLEFYVDALAFEQVDQFRESDGVHSCRLQRDSATLVVRQEDEAPQRRGQGVTIYHMCNDAIAFYREVAERGIGASEPFVGNRMWVTELSDPDGYRLSFESPTDAPEDKKLSDVQEVA